jgi:biopolymer transport protein ExbB
MSVLELLLKGGWVMILMAVLSFLTMLLLLAFSFTMTKRAVYTPQFMSSADVLMKKRDYLGLLAVASRHSEAAARVMQRTLDFATKNPGASLAILQDIAETEGSNQAAALQNRVTYLADIGTVAPMVGLLGTVWGIIKSFAEIGAGTVAAQRDIALASGVSEALIATGAGLMIGLVAFGGYAIFRNRAQALISHLEIATAHLIANLAIQYEKRREVSRVKMDDEF